MTAPQLPGLYRLPQDVGAVVPGRVAALIYARTNLAALRVQLRGTDAEVSAVLEALHIAALVWRGAATGTTVAPVPEPTASSQWLTTGHAAHLCGVTDRAIRKAIAANRLEATQVDGRYRVNRDDLEQYRAARQAA